MQAKKRVESHDCATYVKGRTVYNSKFVDKHLFSVNCVNKLVKSTTFPRKSYSDVVKRNLNVIHKENDLRIKRVRRDSPQCPHIAPSKG